MTFCSACGERVEAVRPFACEHCGEQFWANPRPCAGVLVEHEGEVLLIRRAHEPWIGTWDVPGGFCEVGEHPERTALRELEEETGITNVELADQLGMWMDTYGPAEHPLSILNVYYVALASGERPVPELDPVEASEFGWFGPDALPEMGFPNHQPAVLQAWAASYEARR